jgi:DNA-directed RNA polymerase subunit RPC12/RpoP
MNQDLLAPPKLTARTFAKIVLGVFALSIIVGIGLAALGLLTIGELAVRTAIVGVLSAAAAWAYAGLMRAARRSGPERMPMIHAATGAAGMVAFYGTLGVMLHGTPFGVGAQLLWMIPLMIGMGLAAGGWGRRVGESLHCPQCEYEFGTQDQADAPIRCPECGTGWLGRLKKGRRVRSPRLVAAGIALAFTGMIVLNPIFYMGRLAPHLPTPLLFASLYAAPKAAYTVWDEMATRPLDPSWTRTMAERVLRCRRKDQYDSSPSQWFENMIAGKKIPADLEDRFYREGFQAALVAPRRVKAGEAFIVQLRVHHAANGGGTMGLMFAGYAIGDEPASAGRQDKTVWAYQLRPGVLSRHRDVLPQTLKADHPGELRIRAVFWLVYQPSFADELAWQPDGMPLKPTRATWFERIETEAIVRVE